MKQETKGLIVIYVSTLFFALSNILVKLSCQVFSGSFLAFYRFFIGILLGVIFLIITGKGFKLYDKKYLILRGLFGAFSMTFYYLAIHYNGAGRSTLLNLTFPQFAALFGFLFFGEAVALPQIISLILCAGGVTLVLYDGSGAHILGDIFALMSGVSAGFAVHFMKWARQKNGPVVVYLSACVMGILPNAYTIPEVLHFNPSNFLIITLAAVSVFVGQVLLAYSYKALPTTKASITSYLIMPLTAIFSYLFLNEVLNGRFLIGAGLIAIGLLINNWKKKEDAVPLEEEQENMSPKT